MTTKASDTNTLAEALKHFETAEANLVKLERIWGEIEKFIPKNISFGSTPEHEEKSRLYKAVLTSLPKIDNWRPTAEPMELDDIAQSRLDALEIQEMSATVAVENAIELPGVELRKYRFLLNQKRKELVRGSMLELIDAVDSDIRGMWSEIEESHATDEPASISQEGWESLDNHTGQIDTLLGSSQRPPRWNDMLRHMRFAELHDFSDIKNMDWPEIKKSLMQDMYDENDPIPSEIEDLSILVASKPKGAVTKQLNWKNLDPEGFERLIYTLISSVEGYENPQWLMQTNAPDRGRDLSVDRVVRDPLGGVIRSRVIIQCKHWLTKSISVTEVQTLQGQMKLWEPPRVDVHIIATTGRFSADAVALIEKENQSDRALRIEMWPESHLETLLAGRPNFIAQFSLR